MTDYCVVFQNVFMYSLQIKHIFTTVSLLMSICDIINIKIQKATNVRFATVALSSTYSSTYLKMRSHDRTTPLTVVVHSLFAPTKRSTSITASAHRQCNAQAPMAKKAKG